MTSEPNMKPLPKCFDTSPRSEFWANFFIREVGGPRALPKPCPWQEPRPRFWGIPLGNTVGEEGR